MTREPRVTMMDREVALLELRCLAKILWDVRGRGTASEEDARKLCDILMGWHAIARHYVTTDEMIDAVHAVTGDREFSLNTIRTLFPDIVTENYRAVLQ